MATKFSLSVIVTVEFIANCLSSNRWMWHCGSNLWTTGDRWHSSLLYQYLQVRSRSGEFPVMQVCISRNCLLSKLLRLTAAVFPPRFLRRTSRAWLEPWGPMRAQDSEIPCDWTGVPHPCKRFDFLSRTLKSAKSFEDCFCGRGIGRGTDAGGGDL